MRRIITHREQAEMLAPWRPELRTAAHDPHPDLADFLRLFGCVHTHGGRCLHGAHHFAADFTGPQDVVFNGFDDPRGWKHHVAFNPVRLAVDGARGYASKLGYGDPHASDYSRIMQSPTTMRAVGQAYDRLPMHDAAAVPHFEAMRNEVNHQFDHAVNTMGVRPEFVDHDPYSDVHDMIGDITNNRRLKVLNSATTGGHPYFSNDENDRFRFVHDLFGHAATGRSFDRHGEQAAYQAHAKMFSPQAQPALATETKGQNSSLLLNGSFAPQKLAVLDPQHWRVGRRRTAIPNPNPDYSKMTIEDAIQNDGVPDWWIKAHPKFISWLANTDKSDALKKMLGGHDNWDLVQDYLQSEAENGDQF